MDWKAFAIDLGQTFTETLGPILKAEAADVRNFGFSIAKHLTEALARGDTEWSNELDAQVKGLIELLRIRADEAALDTVAMVAKIGFKIALAAVTAAVKGV